MPLDIEAVRAQLPERRIEYHSSIGSTMDAARELAESGCGSGSTVVAEEQTAGIGRYRRPWHSEPESGLYFSVVLRPVLAPDGLPFVTMALGLAAVDAIEQSTGVLCDLRWPNDVLVEDRKCVGILTRLEGTAIVAGIGINVNHSGFPEELRSTATSLHLASGRPQSREHLLVIVLGAIDQYCNILEREGKRPILEMFSARSSYVQGRRVQVEQDSSLLLRGTTAGLTRDGFLIVRDDNQREHIVIAGGVRPCC